MTIELKPITLCIWLCKDTAISLTRSLRHNRTIFSRPWCVLYNVSQTSRKRFHCLWPIHTQYIYRTVQLVLFAWWNFTYMNILLKTKCTKGCSKDIFYCGIFRSNWWNDCFLSLFPSSFLYSVTEESPPKTGWRAVPCLSLKNHFISTLVPSCLE